METGNHLSIRMVKGTVDKIKTWAIKILASSKSNNSRDGNYFSMITLTLITPINTYFWKIIPVVLDEFPKWLKCSMDRIKDTNTHQNTKLKRIANEKKENRLSVFQGNQKEKKKNNSGEDDLTCGPRDCDIGKSSSMKLYLLLLCENSTRQHLVTTAMVDRIKAGTLDMDYFCLGCNVEPMGTCIWNWNIRSSLKVCAIRCNRECKVIIFPKLIKSAK